MKMKIIIKRFLFFLLGNNIFNKNEKYESIVISKDEDYFKNTKI